MVLQEYCCVLFYFARFSDCFLLVLIFLIVFVVMCCFFAVVQFISDHFFRNWLNKKHTLLG